MVQHVREAEPRISLSVNETPPTDLTLSEARRLQDALRELLGNARVASDAYAGAAPAPRGGRRRGSDGGGAPP